MIKIAEGINLENHTLILPSVAVGNVAQLCIDLLISNLDLHKIGSLWSPMFLPICGLDPYDKNSHSLCTFADFYHGTCNIILLQLRSPYISDPNIFFKELTQFIEEEKISKIIILTSSYVYEQANRSEFNLRYLSSDDSLLNNQELTENLHWKKHTRNIQTKSCSIPGSGFACGLYEHFNSTKIPSTILFCYCSEGDNIFDASILFNGLNKWLHLTKDNSDSVKYPPSWEYFFGNPPSHEIY